MTDGYLIKAALDARKNAYTPYSHYSVGAAVVTGSGKIYTGCNIENASYPATVCAERTAVFKAVSEGEREIKALALAAAKEDIEPPLPEFAAPCGVCRQVLCEFAKPDMRILLAKSETDYKAVTLGELLPMSFTSKNL